jgi:hypothetical protein
VFASGIDFPSTGEREWSNDADIEGGECAEPEKLEAEGGRAQFGSLDFVLVSRPG